MKIDYNHFGEAVKGFDSLEKIWDYPHETGLDALLMPLYERGSILINNIEVSLKDELSSHEIDMKKRVKPIGSMFFRLMLTFFDPKMLYDIIAFRLLAGSNDECREIYDKISNRHPIPEDKNYLWNPNVWVNGPGFRDLLDKPTETGYCSLDYFNIFDDGTIFEVQSRPHEIETNNLSNYHTYKIQRLEELRKLAHNPETREQLVEYFARFFENAQKFSPKKNDSLFEMCKRYDIHGEKEMKWNDKRIHRYR